MASAEAVNTASADSSGTLPTSKMSFPGVLTRGTSVYSILPAGSGTVSRTRLCKLQLLLQPPTPYGQHTATRNLVAPCRRVPLSAMPVQNCLWQGALLPEDVWRSTDCLT